MPLSVGTPERSRHTPCQSVLGPCDACTLADSQTASQSASNPFEESVGRKKERRETASERLRASAKGRPARSGSAVNPPKKNAWPNHNLEIHRLNLMQPTNLCHFGGYPVPRDPIYLHLSGRDRSAVLSLALQIIGTA